MNPTRPPTIPKEPDRMVSPDKNVVASRTSAIAINPSTAF